MADEEIRQIAFGQETVDPCHNQEIASLIDYIDDFMRQLTACPSATERNWLEPDLQITRHNHGRLAGMVESFSADPQLYMPNADRTAMSLASPPELQQPENQGALIIARHLARFRMQLRNGMSAKQASGYHPRELEWVINPALAKLDKYIADEESRFSSGAADYMPDVDDQEPLEATPGNPDNQ
jgi:hypothetical protein